MLQSGLTGGILIMPCMVISIVDYRFAAVFTKNTVDVLFTIEDIISLN